MKCLKFGVIIFFLLWTPIYLFSQTSTEEAALLRESLIAESKKYVGVPYLWGGTTIEGMDCSGFIYTASRNSVGVQLPRTVEAIYGYVRVVGDAKKEKGDILFFKTVGNTISHAGIYIGNNQFIHAVSDGPNTGVIVSSLNQTTWKNAYAGVGQFLPSAASPEASVSSSLSNGDSVVNTSSSGGTGSFFSDMSFDFTAAMLWNFFSTDSFYFNARGLSLEAHMKYTGWKTEPGIGMEVRIEPRMGIVQIPIKFTVSVPYGFRVYAGPVVTFGNAVLIGSGERINPSVFPGILGFSWQSPSAKIGPVGIAFAQDISWVVFNNLDNSALNIGHSFVAGFVFSSGIRICLD